MLLDAAAVILPGVGAFGVAVDNLTRLDLVEVLKDIAQSGIPLLGICLGMQLLMRESAEFGNHRGLGIIEGDVVRIPEMMAGQRQLKVPQVGWDLREAELIRLLDRYRRDDGYYDCVVPGSGGKDSPYAAHVLKYKYGMHPLTVTWPPILYTDIGLKNFRNWIEVGGFDNVTFKPNGRAHRLLTRLSIENLLYPFQSFILGQKNLAPKIALKYDIPMVFYGENEAEYDNPLPDNEQSLRDKSYYTMECRGRLPWRRADQHSCKRISCR